MKKTLLVLTTIISSLTFAQDCSELFISEYVEGWSNNKALEIYNPTASPIDLSAYMIVRYSNGSTTATAANAVQLTGTVAAYDVYVATLDKRDANGTGQEAPIWDSLQVRTDGFYCPDYNTSNAMYFNGDDAVVLAKGTTSDILGAQLIDVFGKIGEDPGTAWTDVAPYNTGVGVELTKDHSLIRKSTILTGVTNPAITTFNALMDYDSIPAVVEINTLTYGNWSSLGSHDCGCNPASINEISKNDVSIYPNPSNGNFEVKGANVYASISVFNALGQEVRSVKNNTKSIVNFNMSERKGVYFVKLSDVNGNVITRKVIIK